MRTPQRALSFLVLFLAEATSMAQGRAKAQTCFFGADFEDGAIPAGWDIGPQVERLDMDGGGTGEFVPAWTVGNAAQANAGLFFPVPDLPTGNKSIMANDDGPPCDCAMGDVALLTPTIDLGGRSGTALECRVFVDITTGGDSLRIEASTDGTVWDPVIVIGPSGRDWTPVFADLSAYDGAPVFHLRFRWSDGGLWAGGVAVDDVCLRERFTHDLSVLAAHTHDPSVDPFVPQQRGLRYSMLPLEQAGAVVAAAEVMNRGRQTLRNLMAQATIDLDGSPQGSFPGDTLDELLPGQRAVLTVPTGWAPPSTGTVSVTVSVVSDTPDDDATDNSANASMRITGPGWDGGYGAMARDEGQQQGTIGSGSGFVAANRMEIVNAGSRARGVSAVIAEGSEVGATVRAILLDANLAVLDTSLRHVLTQADLDQGRLGEALYLPLSSSPLMATTDHFVGLQRLDGGGAVRVGTSGTGPRGAALLMEGITFDVSYPLATPMVRLHVEDFGVGIGERPLDTRSAPVVFPVPMRDEGTVRFALESPSAMRLRILDLAGRTVQERDLGLLPAGGHQARLGVERLATGTYVIELTSIEGRSTARALVAR